MEIILLKMGEMVLKGLNRSRFEASLLRRLRAVLEPFGPFELTSRQSAVYAVPAGDKCDISGAYAAALKVFGFSAVCRAIRCEKEMESLKQSALLLPELKEAASFKVEARRADKRFPLTSPEICAELGGFLHETLGIPVSVRNPGEIVWAEVRESAAYIHARPAEGAGGLPPGTAGSAALLLSGGIDSPVAGWRMARRGLSLLPIHFESYPYTSPEAREKVITIARILAEWCGRMTVRIISLTAIQEAIRKECPEELATLLTRRSMCRLASSVALRNGAGALVTGDSLGQVASQTTEALAVTEEAASLPVLRPLVGMDKEEVSRTARKIGTFETSILPYEDCCGLFTPRHPQTKPRLEAVKRAEELFDFRTLEAETLKSVTKTDV